MRGEDRGVRNVERLLHLKRAPALGSLPSYELARVAEMTRERVFSAGEALLREGEPIPAVYFVVEGRVRIGRKGRIFGVLGPGAGIGSLGVLARDTDGLSVVAETDVLALELDGDAFQDLLEDHFTILRHVIREICRQLLDGWSRFPEAMPFPANPPLPSTPKRDLDLVERIFVLRQGVFANSSINALAELSRGLNELPFEAGTVIWKEDEPAHSVMLIVSGIVSCASEQRGFSFRSRPGLPIGALECMAARPRWYDAVAETPVVALSGDVDEVLDIFEDNFEMAMDYLTTIARWRIHLHEQFSARGEDPLHQFYSEQS